MTSSLGSWHSTTELRPRGTASLSIEQVQLMARMKATNVGTNSPPFYQPTNATAIHPAVTANARTIKKRLSRLLSPQDRLIDPLAARSGCIDNSGVMM